MRKIPYAVVAVALVVLASATAQAAPPKLIGTVGPGFTISLTKGGKKVKKLKAGKYTFVIRDKATIHDFVLEKEKGRGTFERQFTTDPFVGTKRVTVKLTKGKWKYYCAPHESSMFGFFAVK